MTNDTWGLNFTSPIDAKQFRECCVSILLQFVLHSVHTRRRQATTSTDTSTTKKKKKKWKKKTTSATHNTNNKLTYTPTHKYKYTYTLLLPLLLTTTTATAIWAVLEFCPSSNPTKNLPTTTPAATESKPQVDDAVMMTDRDECLMMMRAEVCQVLNLSSFVTVTNCVRAATEAIVTIVYANYRFYANLVWTILNNWNRVASSMCIVI